VEVIGATEGSIVSEDERIEPGVRIAASPGVVSELAALFWRRVRVTRRAQKRKHEGSAKRSGRSFEVEMKYALHAASSSGVNISLTLTDPLITA
jgi:hypothetical protein